MDFSLAALKLMCKQLKEAKAAPLESTQSTGFSLAGILFQRVWLQGVLVSSQDESNTRFMLDDGTAVIEIFIQSEACKRDWKPGMYVMVVGAYCLREGEPSYINVHKMVNLSPYPDREAMWYLEIIEAYKMFYLPFFDDLE